MKTNIAVVALFALVSTGCGEQPAATCDDPIACACAPERRLADATCCPAWTVASDSSCLPREFLLPLPGQTIGGPTARSVSMALDGEGRGFLVWEQSEMVGDDAVIVASETDPGVFVQHKPGSALSGRGTLPVIAATDLGDVVVAWRQSTAADGGDIHLSSRSPEGAWTDPATSADRVSFGQTAYEPRLAARSSGEMLLVWNQWYAGEHYGVALASRPGPDAPWVFPKGEDDVLSAPSFFSNAPQIAVNSAGDALSCWYQSPGQELMAYKSERFGADGVFSRPAADEFVSAEGGDIDSDPVANPKPAVAEDGRAAIVWTQHTKASTSVAVYLATRDEKGVWTRPSSLDDSLSGATGKCRDARAAFDTSGNLFVVWSEDDGAGAVVYLAQRRKDGTWAISGADPLRLSSETALAAINPVLAVGRDGHVLVAWSERLGDFFQVAARRGSTLGFGAVEHLSSPDEHSVLPAVRIGGPRDRGLVAWIAGQPMPSVVKLARVE